MENNDATFISFNAGDPTKQYLICKYGAFYRPDSKGYTHNKEEAGLYDESTAWHESHPNGLTGDRDGVFYVRASDIPDDFTSWAKRGNTITIRRKDKPVYVLRQWW